MKRALIAIALSLACGAAFAQAAGSSIPADQQKVQKDKAQELRAERERLKREARENKRKIKEERREERRKARAAAAKG
jgi:Ni/Co efflux regulator RcnB